VAGPAGFNLSGWTVVLYNGTNGTVYDTLTLSGLIPDQQGCMGAVWFDADQIQNGSNDAIALVDPQGQVVEFLGYEGTMTASEGPAAGLTSVDIGVAETNDGLNSNSIQRSGPGSSPEDFVWVADVPMTHSAVNEGQVFAGCSQPEPQQSRWIVD
jgi:hypothetical protein